MKIKLIFSLLVVAILFYACKEQSNVEETEFDIDLNDSTTIDQLTDQIRENPTNGKLFLLRSKAFAENQQLEDAINDADIALRLDSINPEYYIWKSELALAQGRSGDAKDLLLKCNLLNPENVDILLKLAELYLFVQDYKTSLEYLDEVEDINPSHAEIFFIRGMIYKERNNTESAITSFQVAIEKDPEMYDAYIFLGLLYGEQGDTIALDYYHNALKLMPKSIEAYYNIGMFMQENGWPERAIETYQYILDSIDSNYEVAYYNIAYNYLVNIENYDMAITYFDKAIEVNHEYAEAYYNRGVCYELKSDFKNARVDYETANLIKPNYEMAIEGLNRIESK